MIDPERGEQGMTHIEYDDFGSYEETADLVPVAVPGE